METNEQDESTSTALPPAAAPFHSTKRPSQEYARLDRRREIIRRSLIIIGILVTAATIVLAIYTAFFLPEYYTHDETDTGQINKVSELITIDIPQKYKIQCYFTAEYSFYVENQRYVGEDTIKEMAERSEIGDYETTEQFCEETLEPLRQECITNPHNVTVLYAIDYPDEDNSIFYDSTFEANMHLYIGIIVGFSISIASFCCVMLIFLLPDKPLNRISLRQSHVDDSTVVEDESVTKD